MKKNSKKTPTLAITYSEVLSELTNEEASTISGGKVKVNQVQRSNNQIIFSDKITLNDKEFVCSSPEGQVCLLSGQLQKSNGKVVKDTRKVEFVNKADIAAIFPKTTDSITSLNQLDLLNIRDFRPV